MLLGSRSRRDDDWEGYRPRGDAAQLPALVEKAVPFLQSGDGRNALRILEAVAEPLVESWTAYGYTDDEESLPFSDLGDRMAEAALMGDLSDSERADLAATLRDWEDSLSDYGGDGFAVAIRALETGWDDPGLRAVLEGAPGPWPPEEAEDLDDLALTGVLLRVLDGPGRHDAYLKLARAAGAHTRVAAMLVRLGRVDAAVAHAKQTFATPAEALELAQVLDGAGRKREAVDVAQAGLALGRDAGRSEDGGWPPARPVVPLARWLRAAASGEVVLRAARTAFEHTLALDDFYAVEVPAGRAWATVREDLLARLIAAESAGDRAEILLREGMIDEAVASVGTARPHETSEPVLLALMDAALASHPDWVIGVAEVRAAVIMDANASGRYAAAAEWLRRAALAYESDGRIDAWSARIAGLIETHKRKYKLRPMLEALRFGG